MRDANRKAMFANLKYQSKKKFEDLRTIWNRKSSMSDKTFIVPNKQTKFTKSLHEKSGIVFRPETLWSLSSKDGNFWSEPKLKVVTPKKYDHIADYLDDDKKLFGKRGGIFVVTDKQRALGVDTQGYAYPRYKGALVYKGKNLPYK